MFPQAEQVLKKAPILHPKNFSKTNIYCRITNVNSRQRLICWETHTQFITEISSGTVL